MLHTLSVSILPALLIIAAASDVLSLRIPNWLNILMAALFFPMAWFTGMPMAEFGIHLAVGAGLFVFGFLLFQVGLFGGGDAKLMAAAGLWFGSAQALPFLFMTALAGGLLALYIAVWSIIKMHLDIHVGEEKLGSFGKRFLALKPNVPYGLAFAVGGIIVFRDSWWMQAIA
jgi:prepilin peptidase CpaA